MPQRETGKRLSEYNNILKENDNLYRGVAKRLGLPECAFWILYTLRADSAALTQSEIGDLLYQPKQTVNSALKNLEAEGYIERLRTDDRRSKPIRLTERGAELAERTVDKVIAAERKSLLDLTEAEQDAFIGLFRQYTDALERHMRDLARVCGRGVSMRRDRRRKGDTMRIQLSDHFTYKKIWRFSLPPIVMMVFTSIYGVVDGLFVSNFVGKVPFAAINLVMPFIMILGGFGFMIGTGGSALVAKTIGEGDREKANRYFSMMIQLTLAAGIVLSVIGVLFIRPISYLLGATDAMIEDCVVYGRVVLLFNTAFMLQNVFQTFLAAAEKPKLGLAATVAAGVTNMALDALFVAGFRWGVGGAALATGISQCIGGVLPLLYFLRPNSSLLRLTKARPEGRVLLKACANGSSELMTNISGSLVSMLYNVRLLKFAGENGVAAYGVLMYIQFIFIAIFIGYTIGMAPVVGYHYGAENTGELKSLLRKSLLLMGIAGVLMMLVA